MTNIAAIKQVMQSDGDKVNSICIYEVEPNICRENTRTRNYGRTSNKKCKNTYGTIAVAVALDLGSVSSPAMSSRRSWTSGKKSSSGK